MRRGAGTTLHDVAVIGVQSHDVLAVFGHVQKFAAILVYVGYLKMMSYDVTRHRATFLRNSRATYDVVRLHLGSYDIARPSYDRCTTLQRLHDHRATLIYKTILASHHAIIVKSYVSVRLSFDCRTLSYDLPMI